MSTADTIVFERYGRSYHLRIETARDLENAVNLNEAHWVSTSAPLAMFYCDKTFLKLLDKNNSGRILCHEVKDAIRFILAVLRDRTAIDAHSDILALDALATDTAEGKRVLEAGQEILERLGQKESRQLTLEQIRRLKAEVEATAVSEAGVVLPAAAAEAEIREFISDVIATVGGAAHPGGGEGVDSTHLAAFLEQAHAFLQWRGHGQVPKGKKKTDIMPLGAKTPEAYRLFSALRGKIDQYFAQCVAVTLDERFAQRMGWLDSELEGLDFDDPAVIERVLRKAPLAKATPEQTLDFDSKLNPYYVGTLEEFRRKVVAPVLGKSEPKLTPDDWDRIKSFFAAHDNWVRNSREQTHGFRTGEGASARKGYPISGPPYRLCEQLRRLSEPVRPGRPGDV